jgi:hypothetical protein
MSDSDSDYVVSDFITPTLGTRHTYSKTDDSYLSEEGDFTSDKEEKSDDSEIETSCKIPKTSNVEKPTTSAISATVDRKEDEDDGEPVRPNSEL